MKNNDVEPLFISNNKFIVGVFIKFMETRRIVDRFLRAVCVSIPALYYGLAYAFDAVVPLGNHFY